MYNIQKIEVEDKNKMSEVEAFLMKNDLKMASDILIFVVIIDNNSIIASAGISEGGIIKCVAIDENYRGHALMLKLFTEIYTLCIDYGFKDLYVFTKPENELAFKDCGFYTIESAADKVILMENSKTNIENYCHSLKTIANKISGNKIGSIVLNANPFTLGHLYLIEQAASQCDWVHLLVVKENKSYFSYEDRYRLIEQGIAHLKNVTLHHGSNYIISRATFPTYFLKDDKIIDLCQLELDLKIFRHYIAPALNITHRFVGTEPFCIVTNNYNKQMKYWLSEANLPYPKVEVVELERTASSDVQISASQVRELFFEDKMDELKPLVPITTYNYLIALKNKSHK